MNIATSQTNVSDNKEPEKALLDYEDTTARTLSDKYRCRNCGQLYDTIEAHDRHQREMHNRTKKYPLEELPM
ncbi:hypothetical protein [Candidatus Bathycorpusculum sp.]|jgi:rubredoxin|uniref:hypothetical protein n=1 Tax=Candidatus Bathycorpusculum sp. TaxID=2994959 RepID=UPI0028316020|nr:hypothetical protein [Candidatus Termitimicrobium sp.]MCL2686549.1 hypothetical protein [Candidatus Termitimicrobium sp.]